MNSFLTNIHKDKQIAVMEETHKKSPGHNRLPSFSELIQTFPGYHQYGGEAPESRRHSISSSITLPSVIHSPQSSIGNPPSYHYITTDAIRQQPSYSYGRVLEHSRDDSYPYQFRFPESAKAELPVKQLPTLQIPPKHIGVSGRSRSISLPWISSTQNLGSEEDIIGSLNKLFESLRETNDFVDSLQSKYLALVNNSPSKRPENEDVLEGYITSSAGRKYINRSSFNEFILSIPSPTMDALTSNYDQSVKVLEHIKNLRQRLSTSKQITQQSQRTETGSRGLGISSGPAKHPEKLSQPYAIQEGSSSTPQQVKKKRKPVSNWPKDPRSGGEIITLKINTPSVEESKHGAVLGKGGLNTELSIRPNIVCKHCGSRDTPEWRRGPDGSRTLCNACGLFYSKLIKKYGLREANKVMKERKHKGLVSDRRIT